MRKRSSLSSIEIGIFRMNKMDILSFAILSQFVKTQSACAAAGCCRCCWLLFVHSHHSVPSLLHSSFSTEYCRSQSNRHRRHGNGTKQNRKRSRKDMHWDCDCDAECRLTYFANYLFFKVNRPAVLCEFIRFIFQWPFISLRSDSILNEMQLPIAAWTV